MTIEKTRSVLLAALVSVALLGIGGGLIARAEKLRELPEKIEEIDLVRLQVVEAEIRAINAEARVRAAPFLASQQRIASKYHIDATVKIDMTTGELTRASDVAPAAK